jgi:hypothetical protein
MGTNMTVRCEKLTPDGWQEVKTPDYDGRDYDLFAFLGAGPSMNYCKVPEFPGFRGLTNSEHARYTDEDDYHSGYNYLANIDDLLAFDYDQPFEYRRCHEGTTDTHSGGRGTLPERQGRMTTYREEFGYWPDFLVKCKAAGAERILWGFGQ